MNRVFAAAKGNDDTNIAHFPSDYDESWIISVGATDRGGARATSEDPGWTFGSNYGNGIDVVAPGTATLSTMPTTTTSTMSAQGWPTHYAGVESDPGVPISGTSMATPHVSGLAALLIGEAQSKGITLHPEDVQGIIRASAEDINSSSHPGYDQFMGAGRINAARALAMLQDPWNLRQTFALGGSVTSSTGTYALPFLNSVMGTSGSFIVKRYEVRKTSYFSLDYTDTPHVWCRGANESIGWSAASPNYQTGYCEVLSNTASSVDLRTYVYEVWEIDGDYLGYYPTTPQNVRFEYTTLGQPAPLSVSMSGPYSIASSEGGTWTANVSGGDAPYAYLWEYEYPCPDDPPCPTYPNCIGTMSVGPQCGGWSATGTSSTLTRTFAATFGRVNLRLRVTDDDATTRTTQRSITVSSGRPAGEDIAGAKSGGRDDGQSTDAQSEAGRGAAATDGAAVLPSEPALRGAVPNPFRGETEIAFALPEASEVRLVVYDLLGREAAVLVDDRAEAGHHRVRFDGQGLPSGVYVARLVAGAHVETVRLTLVR